MQVNLKRGWFAPDGSLYAPSGNPHTFPNDWRGKLPSTAEAFEEPAPVVAKPLAKPVKPDAE